MEASAIKSVFSDHAMSGALAFSSTKVGNDHLVVYYVCLVEVVILCDFIVDNLCSRVLSAIFLEQLEL